MEGRLHLGNSCNVPSKHKHSPRNSKKLEKQLEDKELSVEQTG